MNHDKFRGCLLGLAVGDAVGATNEFRHRKDCNVRGMEGGGFWKLRPGDWTDDTSMAFGLAESLARNDGFDPHDVMMNWAAWYQGINFGGSHDRGCFDVGGTTRKALQDFLRTGDPWQGQVNDFSAANGCLMRFAPVALYTFPMSPGARREVARKSSALTHGHRLCLAATECFSDLLQALLEGGVAAMNYPRIDAEAPELRAVFERQAWNDDTPKRICSGGYVLDTLEAAMWACQERGDDEDNFEACVLRAANLGNDADTVAAVAGQIAGAEYGLKGIPAEWLEVLDRRDELLRLADDLYDNAVLRHGFNAAKKTQRVPASRVSRILPLD